MWEVRYLFGRVGDLIGNSYYANYSDIPFFPDLKTVTVNGVTYFVDHTSYSMIDKVVEVFLYQR